MGSYTILCFFFFGYVRNVIFTKNYDLNLIIRKIMCTYFFDDAKEIYNATRVHVQFARSVDVNLGHDNVQIDKR